VPFDLSGEKGGGKGRLDDADSLREQAAACRRLSVQARTRQGIKALEALGDHFDEQARKLDPLSMKR
jgi:hypothetical protein